MLSFQLGNYPKFAINPMDGGHDSVVDDYGDADVVADDED